ncbi:MAG: HAD hydrolase-like protein, partial [Herbaspirillum sp.]
RAQHAGARIDAIFFCPHLPNDHCDCRKPKNGLLTEIARRFDTNLQGVPSVGDSLRDLEASISVGCRPYLVLTGKGMLTNTVGGLPAGTQVCADLAAVAEQLLSPAGLVNAVELSH